MKQKLLLFLFIGSLAAPADAQRKEQKTTAYAITASQKGSSSWTEVRLVDVKTGEVLQTVYENKGEVPTLNARTKKPVAKRQTSSNDFQTTRAFNNQGNIEVRKNGTAVAYTFDKQAKSPLDVKEKVSVDLLRSKKDGTTPVEIREITVTGKPLKSTDVRMNVNVHTDVNTNVNTTHRIVIRKSSELLDRPFSTTSAACAYDKKHERLYYTPMGINELRYIDLKAKTPSIYYFENEAFGVLSSRNDVQNQVTRMVIAGDGNGYALTNNGRHLIKFTTDKRGTITDLGELTDAASNGRYSIHSSGGYGGDMVADEKNSLYLIQANKSVFKISLDTKVASFVGSIKGLPREFSTNGAAVESGTSIIVSSANSTLGYYKFNLEDLHAEKISSEGPVFNASDLANGNLISVKKKKADKETVPVVEEKETLVKSETMREDNIEALQRNNISVYPNPVAMGGVVKVAFKGQPNGMYTLQFIDISGKLISSKQVSITNRQQTEEFALPELSARGNYLLKAVSEGRQVVSVNKVVVQ